MEHYAGIDVSLELSSVCVVDAKGKIVKEAKVPSDPEALVLFFTGLGFVVERIGIEAGPLSQWLHAGLAKAGFETVLLETRHVKAALPTIIRIEPTGRFFERSSNGGEVDLGVARVFEPPRRLLIDWYPGTDPAHPTRVEVTFISEGEMTRVRVQHGPTAASEDLFPDRAPRFASSWELVLAGLTLWAGKTALDSW